MIDLISKSNSMGHQLEEESGHIKIENAASLPDDLKAELIQHKVELVESLKRDKQIRSIGGQIGIPGTLYSWTVSHSSTAYIEKTVTGWIAYRESYVPSKKKANSYKVICEGNTFDYVFTQYEKYIGYINRMWR